MADLSPAFSKFCSDLGGRFGRREYDGQQEMVCKVRDFELTLNGRPEKHYILTVRSPTFDVRSTAKLNAVKSEGRGGLVLVNSKMDLDPSLFPGETGVVGIKVDSDGKLHVYC